MVVFDEIHSRKCVVADQTLDVHPPEVRAVLSKIANESMGGALTAVGWRGIVPRCFDRGANIGKAANSQHSKLREAARDSAPPSGVCPWESAVTGQQARPHAVSIPLWKDGLFASVSRRERRHLLVKELSETTVL